MNTPQERIEAMRAVARVEADRLLKRLREVAPVYDSAEVHAALMVAFVNGSIHGAKTARDMLNPPIQ